jgi:hypothetical protein
MIAHGIGDALVNVSANPQPGCAPVPLASGSSAQCIPGRYSRLNIFRSAIVATAGIALATLFAPTGQANSTIVSVLGDVGPAYYSLLVVGGAGTFSMNDSTVQGNVGIATNPFNSAPCAGWGGGANAAITGTLYNDPGAGCADTGEVPAGGTSSIYPGSHPTAAQLVSDVSAVVTDFSNAASNYGAVAAGLTGVSGGSISGNATITAASSGWSVANLTNITETNGNVTISGTANSQLVVNLTGALNISNGSILLTGGITPYDVVFNIMGASNALTVQNAAGSMAGIFLAPGTGNSLHDQTLTGQVISGLSGLQITSAFDLNDTFQGSPTPEPGSAFMTIMGFALVGVLARRWSRRPARQA